MTNSRYATDDIGAVDWTTVPCISGSMGGFDKKFVSTAVVCSDGYCLVMEAGKVFNTHSLVVTASGNMDVNIENGTDHVEETLESAAVIDHDKAAETDFEEDILNEESGEIMSGDIVGGCD